MHMLVHICMGKGVVFSWRHGPWRGYKISKGPWKGGIFSPAPLLDYFGLFFSPTLGPSEGSYLLKFTKNSILPKFGICALFPLRYSNDTTPPIFQTMCCEKKQHNLNDPFNGNRQANHIIQIPL